MQLTEGRREYWSKNLVYTILLFISFVVTFRRGSATSCRSTSFRSPFAFCDQVPRSLRAVRDHHLVRRRYMNNLTSIRRSMKGRKN